MFAEQAACKLNPVYRPLVWSGPVSEQRRELQLVLACGFATAYAHGNWRITIRMVGFGGTQFNFGAATAALFALIQLYQRGDLLAFKTAVYRNRRATAGLDV